MTALSWRSPPIGREQVLIDSNRALLALDPPPEEVAGIDQTPDHEPSTRSAPYRLDQQARLRGSA